MRSTLAWKEAVDGRAPRRARLAASPAIGKTRLVTELARAPHDAGGDGARGGAATRSSASPYQPFVEALRHYVARVRPTVLRAELGPLGGELRRLVPELACARARSCRPGRAEADTERHRLFEAVSDLLAAMSHNEPVVLVLDDLHWADKPSLLLLRHLVCARRRRCGCSSSARTATPTSTAPTR